MSSYPYTNHLISQKSPYLLQHAHNPVDWYPWGEEAFELARHQDKPIFLSIGYATCHWCHVMEHESFENLEIAKLMNEVFINIKVDREERPDIDSLYMEFAQALMSSAGGWPLNVILTPDLKPFFAITYLPPKSRRGLIGLDQFIHHVQQLWQSEERHQLTSQAEKIVEIFARSSQAVGEEIPEEKDLLNAVQQFLEIADPIYGGIKGEPKFPLGYQLNFLLNFTKAKSEERSLFYVELTLDCMARGGIYDHLGGGFSRYSVDERWLVPHFEKMLYDNAILSKTYLDAWKFTKKAEFKRICEETLNYVLREMAQEEGGFYSAEDADSEGHEGRFYTWTPKEIVEVVSLEDAELFCQFYGVTPQGNFEGRSILHIDIPLSEFAEMKMMTEEELETRLLEIHTLLQKQRSNRTRPFKDDKILCSWNGLMIDALIAASSALDNLQYRGAALKAAEFIRGSLWKEGKLLRRYRDKDAAFAGGLEDYAFLIKGLLSLFEEGCGTNFLEWAVELAATLKREFKAEGGAFYSTNAQEAVLLRKCEFYDGAEPSGNAVHAEILLRLYQLTHLEDYLLQAEDILKAAKKQIQLFAPGACFHLIVLQRYLAVAAPTIVIALDEKNTGEQEIRALLGRHFLPFATIVWKLIGDHALILSLPTLASFVPVDGKTAIYICRQDHCEAPLKSVEELARVLETL
ncbi:MAG: thioredoxin domain-containing protein [Anaerolineae bacterium]